MRQHAKARPHAPSQHPQFDGAGGIPGSGDVAAVAFLSKWHPRNPSCGRMLEAKTASVDLPSRAAGLMAQWRHLLGGPLLSTDKLGGGRKAFPCFCGGRKKDRSCHGVAPRLRGSGYWAACRLPDGRDLQPFVWPWPCLPDRPVPASRPSSPFAADPTRASALGRRFNAAFRVAANVTFVTARCDELALGCSYFHWLRSGWASWRVRGRRTQKAAIVLRSITARVVE